MPDIPRVDHTTQPNEAWAVAVSELVNAMASAQPDTKQYAIPAGGAGKVTVTFAEPYRIKPGIAAIAEIDDGYVSIHKSTGTNGWTLNGDGDFTAVTFIGLDSGGAALANGTVILVTVYKKFQT